MKKLFPVLMLLMGATQSFAAEEKAPVRAPASNPSASVKVFNIQDSRHGEAEKWVDNQLGVVCYSANSGNGLSVSCVKFK